MRTVALLAIVVCSSTAAFADSEHYEQIRVDGGLTGSSVGVSDRDGVGMVTEIKGMVHDNIAIGGRVEIAMMFGGHIGQDALPLSFAMAACGLLKAEVYAGSGPIRPFVGFGAGAYTIGSQTIERGPNTSGIQSAVGRYFGIAPQIGVDLGPVRLAATYNALAGASLEVQDMVGNVMRTSRVSQNYLSLEVSFQFAGGRKRAPIARPANNPRR
jgi:hypothetical protein